MNKKMKIVIYFLAFCLLVACQSNNNKSNKVQVAVSIVPQEDFVKAVAGELVDIVTLIPPGSSPEVYQPTQKQLTKLSEASIYFSIGVPTEKANILPSLDDFNKNIRRVDLASTVDKVYPDIYFNEAEIHEGEEEHNEEEHSHEGRDPHIWMSPKRVIIMVETIRDELSVLDPSNKSVYQENAAKYIKQLQEVDTQVSNTMDKLVNKEFIIMHPSMGYFADDYGLKMIAIEENGKETTAIRLQKVIDMAKEHNIKVVFYQAEFDNQQAKTLAKEINGETMELKPLAPDYVNNLYKINEVFQKALE